MVHLTASDMGPFQKEVNNHKQKNKIKMDQTFWSEDNMEILISGDRKEVANCGWREGSSTLSTQEAVIFKRGLEKFQKEV